MQAAGCRFRGEAMPRILGLAGCACLLVVALTHVAERWNILPRMGWGLPNSPGHYLDLVSAIAGIGLLLAAAYLKWRNASPRSRPDTVGDEAGGAVAAEPNTRASASNQGLWISAFVTKVPSSLAGAQVWCLGPSHENTK